MNAPSPRPLSWLALLALLPCSGPAVHAQGNGRIGGGASYPTVPGMSAPVTRHHEHSMEWGGRSAALNVLGAPSVQADLALRPEQRKAISDALQGVHAAGTAESDARQQRFEARLQRLEQLDERNKALVADAEKFGEEIVDVLTPDQRRILAQLQKEGRQQPPMVGASANAGSSPGTSPNAVVRTSQSSMSSGGLPGSVVRALQHPDALRRLNLAPGQRATVQDVLARFQQRERRFLDESAPLRNIRPPGLSAETDATAGAEFQRRTTEVLALLTPLQQKRLDEIRRQVAGPEVLFWPDVVAELRLTATQQARLAALKADTEPQGGGSPGTPIAPAAPPQATLRRMLQEVLTPAQRQTFEKLKGRPCHGVDQIPAVGGGSRRMGGGGIIYVPH